MNKIILKGALCVVLTCFVNSGYASIFYVEPTGKDDNDGASWATAKKTIQAGINAATNGDMVLVADGEYVLTNTIYVHQGINVKSVNGANSTIVNGGYPARTNRCFVVSTNAIVEGFTISKGSASSYMSSNHYYEFESGGGVFNAGGLIKSCIIASNVGLIISSSGGVHNDSGILDKCLVYGNYGFKGAGVFNNGIVQNCVIVGNQTCGNEISLAVGGVCNSNNGVMRSSTIVGNGYTEIFGGIYPQGGVHNTGRIIDCIIYYNKSRSTFGDTTYSCVESITNGIGNITNEPQFVSRGISYGTNYVMGDLHLLPTSPCIDNGKNESWMTTENDYDSNQRIVNGIVDMGAFEYQASIGPDVRVNNVAGPLSVAYGYPITVTLSMKSGDYAGRVADWWVLAVGPGMLYYLELSNMQPRWIYIPDISGMQPVYQGPLFDIGRYYVLQDYQWLPRGTYSFYFGVDFNPNGVLDLDGIWYDWAVLSVE